MIRRKLCFHELVHLRGISRIDRPIRVANPAIIEHQLRVVHKSVQIWVLIRFEFVFHDAEV